MHWLEKEKKIGRPQKPQKKLTSELVSAACLENVSITVKFDHGWHLFAYRNGLTQNSCARIYINFAFIDTQPAASEEPTARRSAGRARRFQPRAPKEPSRVSRPRLGNRSNHPRVPTRVRSPINGD